MPTDTDRFVTVARASDLEPGEMMYVEYDDEPVCLINLDGEYLRALRHLHP